MIRRQQVICSNIDRELDVGQRELHKTQKRAAEVEQHIERYAVELSEEHAKYFAALDEVKAREARVSEIEKMVEKEEEKLQQQQALYDSVRADRNLYSKSLIDCNAEIEEMKRKFKIAFHRIEQVNSEVRKKEAKIVNVDLERTRIARGNDRIKESLDSGLERIQGLKCIVDVQKGESEKLKVVMEEAEGEVTNYEKALESVVSERELLEKQLSNREAEVKKMYEKIRLLESDLRQGDTTFNGLLKDRRGVDRQLLALRREINDMKLEVAEGKSLFQQKMRLSKEIQAEVLKCSKLQQELEKPMNIHRWRRLESSDLKTFEALKRIRELQHRLIQAQEKVVEKEKEISKKESEFMSLKTALQRQPGPEIHDQILLLQQAVKDKQGQLTALERSMRGFREQCDENSAEVKRLEKQRKEMNDEFIEKSRQPLSARNHLLSSQELSVEEDSSTSGLVVGS